MSESAGFAQYPSLRDRVVVITGGGSGIGASMVEHFCLQGARVALLDILVKESQELVRAMEKRCGAAPLFVECDLKNIDGVARGICESGRDAWSGARAGEQCGERRPAQIFRRYAGILGRGDGGQSAAPIFCDAGGH